MVPTSKELYARPNQRTFRYYCQVSCASPFSLMAIAQRGQSKLNATILYHWCLKLRKSTLLSKPIKELTLLVSWPVQHSTTRFLVIKRMKRPRYKENEVSTSSLPKSHFAHQVSTSEDDWQGFSHIVISLFRDRAWKQPFCFGLCVICFMPWC